MSLAPIPLSTSIVETAPRSDKLQTASAWRSWLTNLYAQVKPLGGNGTTAQRPTTGLYVGMGYFDSTLGYPVWVKALGPPAVWVNGAGGVV